MGRCVELVRQQTVNLWLYEHGGSSPSLPTRVLRYALLLPDGGTGRRTA